MSRLAFQDARGELTMKEVEAATETARETMLQCTCRSDASGDHILTGTAKGVTMDIAHCANARANTLRAHQAQQRAGALSSWRSGHGETPLCPC